MKTTIRLNKEMHFISTLDGFDINLDADKEFGGKDNGPKPKGLVLTALGGCTAMDVISILRKMRSEPEEFHIDIEAEVSQEHPKVFTKINLKYFFKGDKINETNAKKAIDLSLDKYCAVANILKQAVPITYEIVIE